MIEILQLHKSYGHQKVLNDINFCFEKGKVYGVMGDNGAGKTTLFRCMAGLESYEGQIKSTFHPLKEHLGLLLTENFFFSKITGEEYIRLILSARGESCHNISKRNIFNLPLKQYASTYSTGMKKKLALTAILLQKNEVYIFDEPFNGVDLQSNWLITEIIQQLKIMGKTILMSSHIFSTLKDCCDELIQLENGQIKNHILSENFSFFQVKISDELSQMKNNISQILMD